MGEREIKPEELAEDDIDGRTIEVRDAILKGEQPIAAGGECFGRERSDDDALCDDVLAGDFMQQVGFVFLAARIAGGEADEERVPVKGSHGAVAQAQDGFGHGFDVARGQLQDFERGFPGDAGERARTEDADAFVLRGGELPRAFGSEGKKGFAGADDGIEDGVIGRLRPCVGEALAEDDHVGKGTGHGEATVIHSIIKDDGAGPGMIANDLQHAACGVAGDDEVGDIGIFFEGLDERGDAFGRSARAGEGNPKIAAAGNNGIGHVGEQVRAGDGEGFAAPFCPKQQGEDLTDVVGGTGASEDDSGTLVEWGSDAASFKEGAEAIALLAEDAAGDPPGVGLLGNFAGRGGDAHGFFFIQRQVD